MTQPPTNGADRATADRTDVARDPWPVHVAVFLAALAVLVLRRPETLLRAEFLAEDGQVFFLGTFFGSPLDALLRPYNGYLHVVPRLVAGLERLVPVSWAPFVGNFAALAIVAAIATFLASDRMAGVLPDRRARWLAAAGFVLLPTSHETLGSITFIQSYLVILAVAIAISRPPASRAGRSLEAAVLALCALSTPVAPLLALLFIVRLGRFGRPALLSAITAVVTGAVQAVLVAVSGSPGSGGFDAPTIAQAALLRMVVEPVWGAIWTALAVQWGIPAPAGLIAAIVIAGLLAVVLTSFDRVVALQLIAVALVVGMLGIVRSGAFIGAPQDPLIIQRYFVTAAWVVVVVVSGGLFAHDTRVRAAAVVLAAMLVMGVVADFRLPPRPVQDWAAHNACIGGEAPCVVPVFPPDAFSIRWPGSGGVYDQGDWVR